MAEQLTEWTRKRIAEESGRLQSAQALEYKWAFPVADGLSVLRELQVWQRAAELLAQVAAYCCSVEGGRLCSGCPMYRAGRHDCRDAETRNAWAVAKARAELEAKPDGN